MGGACPKAKAVIATKATQARSGFMDLILPGAVRTVESELGEFSSNQVAKDITYFSNIWLRIKKQILSGE
jgi:hypothetical protein